jgi:hypothetical protein
MTETERGNRVGPVEKIASRFRNLGDPAWYADAPRCLWQIEIRHPIPFFFLLFIFQREAAPLRGLYEMGDPVSNIGATHISMPSFSPTV